MPGEARGAKIGDKAGRVSDLYHGSASDYLTETGAYALYQLNLSAGDYLQARLHQPGDPGIDYDLKFYDSSLNLIKASEYFTLMNGPGTLEESVGYLAAADEIVYICVISALGGSETEAYTLEFSIRTNFSDASEPNENAPEAIALAMGDSGAEVTGALSSPVDNDWYAFTVSNTSKFDRTRFILNSDASKNGCQFEIYQNVITDGYAMRHVAYGSAGELELSDGTYFIRVVSTNTFSDFDVNDNSTYSLSISPAPRVDGISITKISGYNMVEDVEYHEGSYCRIDDNDPNWVAITGFVYREDSFGNKSGVPDVPVTASVLNNQWHALGQTELAETYGSAVSGSNGFFTIIVYMLPALGGLSYEALVSTHYYDFMNVKVMLTYNLTKYDEDHFYILQQSVLD